MSISLFRSIANQYQNLRQINSVSMMNVISHQIEDQVVQRHLAVDFYAGFQKFSNFPDQLRRYSRLGGVCRRVYVFGTADYRPERLPGVEFVEISPTSPLTREWFLLVDTPNFWTTLVAQEVEGQDAITGGRCFDGLWSFDETVVDRISLLVSQVMETSYEPVQVRKHSQQNIHISEIHRRLLGMHEQCELTSQRRWAQLRTLQSVSELTSRNPLELLQGVARILHTIFGAEGVVIALRVADDQLKILVVEGNAIGQGWKLPLSHGLSGKALHQKRAVQILDATRRQVGEPLLPAAKALIAVPIMHRWVHGAITIGHLQPGRWSEEEAQALMTLGRSVAVHLELFLSRNATMKKSSGSSSVPISGIRC